MQEVERLREYLNIVPLFVIHTGKSLSEALIFASTNPQYVHKLLFLFCFDIQNNLFAQHIEGAPVAFKTWCGHQYRVGIICPTWLRQG